MRAILGALGVLFLAAWGSSCGPPPPELTGSLNYSIGCRMVGCSAIGGTQNPNGVEGSGSPALHLRCTVQAASAGQPAAFSLQIYRGTDVITTGYGVAICGTVTASGQDANTGRVDLFLNGEQSSNNGVPGTCHIHVNNIGMDSIDGRLQCTDAPDNGTPTKLLYVSGVAGGATPTADPLWADFAFTTCTQGTVICRH